MTKQLTLDQKREWAELLYTRHNETQKAIAEKVGVSENTISKWKEKYNWEAARKTLLASKETTLRNYYTILDNINQRILGKDGDGVGTTADSDMAVKYATAINKLETETNVGNMIEMGIKFIQEVQTYDMAFAQQISRAFDDFISKQLKRFK